MSVVSRGVKNAFRNGLRTSAVVLILAISIGLSLSMLVANKAVEGRIADLKEDIGTTIRINPAGSQGFQGGGEPLTTADLNKVRQVDDVASAEGVTQFNLQTESDDDSAPSNFMIRGGGGGEVGETDLESPVDAGTLGQRFNSSAVGEDGEDAPEIKLPIQGIGTDGNIDTEGNAFNITDGRGLKDGDTYSAVVGKSLAEKNDLKVGSTFKAFDKTFKVVGILDQGTEFANATVVIPMATAQELNETEGEVSVIIAKSDSIETLESAMSNIKEALGEDNADVTTTQQNIQEAVESLKSVQNISIVGFVASLSAAAIIVLMVMFVIVRERRREIGVLKAIGGSNVSIVTQFIVEAIVLVGIGGIIGLGTAVVSSGAVANALVSSNVSSSEDNTGAEGGFSSGGPRGGGGPRRIQVQGTGDRFQDTKELVGDVTANVGGSTILSGAIGILAVAILGSAIPAWLIAKVRPAEVLRGE